MFNLKTGPMNMNAAFARKTQYRKITTYVILFETEPRDREKLLIRKRTRDFRKKGSENLCLETAEVAHRTCKRDYQAEQC